MSQKLSILTLTLVVVLGACAPGASMNPDMGPLPEADVAEEWVAYHAEVPLVPADFDALASGLFGSAAQAGMFSAEKQIAPGVFMVAGADTSAAGQARLALSFDDGNGNTRRALAVAPVSFAVGEVFITAVDAALAKMQADNVKSPHSGEEFYIEYRVHSSNGGSLSFGVRGNMGVYTMVLDVSSPHTSLDAAHIGQPATSDSPYDTVAGTVWFHLSKDDFDFFVDRAYGAGAAGKQNFNDFALDPHDWLRLTVEPHLDQKFVNVGFQVLSTDGKRVDVAKAPASILAGDAFHSLVSHSMLLTRNAEKAMPGSSIDWQAPFYYDNPNGGGVVQVIAESKSGVFDIAYAIESPRHKLVDVPPVKYQDVMFPPPDPNASASCEMLGGKPAPKGVFVISFIASNVVKKSPDLMNPLMGTISCSVYKASDVNIGGPLDGAVSQLDFSVANADLSGMTPPMFTTSVLWAGDYQILCGQDINHDGKVDFGDPVTLPIGAVTVACDVNPVTVEFALLDPQM